MLLVLPLAAQAAPGLDAFTESLSLASSLFEEAGVDEAGEGVDEGVDDGVEEGWAQVQRADGALNHPAGVSDSHSTQRGERLCSE